MVPFSLECAAWENRAAPSRPSFSVPRGFPARAHLQPRVFRFMKGPCQNKKLRSFMAAEPVQDGGYLLSRECSTIGAGGLNFSVRDGKRWDPAA